jgi:glycosyltransferase involved in cell wall biosynthesis
MVSVIVPAHEEERYLGATLDALRASTPFETVVVANACTDDTAGVARRRGVRVVETATPGVSHARNLGAAASAGDVLLFLDADTVLAPGALDAFAAAIPARGDYGTCRIRPAGGALRARVTTALLAWGHRVAGTSLAVLACTRDLFARSGGFDEAMVAGEDNDLNARLARLGGRRLYLGRVDAYTSMRRFERLGYVRTNLAWLRGWARPPDVYDVVR